MMIIFWLITPLQGTLFGPQAVVLRQQSAMSAQLALLPMEKQAAAMDVTLLSRAYSSSWLGQPLPAYTTSSYAILPFSPLDGDPSPRPNETWTGRTTKLATDITCWSGILEANGLESYEVDNGRGCKVNISLSNGRDAFFVGYIGYWDDARVDWALESPACGMNASHQFLALVSGVTTDGVVNSTAMFCETSYTKQDVMVTVSAGTQQPDSSSIMPLGDPVSLGEDEFNITAYEYLIGTGFPSIDEPRDFGGDLRLEQFGSIYSKNISWPTTNMVGFALSRYNGSTAELLDHSLLESLFAGAHRVLFSVAVSQLLAPAEHLSQDTGHVQYSLYGVVVSRPFSIAVESLLVLVAFLTGLIALICQRTNSNLTDDPASLRSLIHILRGSNPLLDQFIPLDSLDEGHLRTVASGQKYQLLSNRDSKVTSQLILVEENIRREVPPAIRSGSAPAGGYYQPVRPYQLRPVTGVALIAALFAGIGVLVYLKKQEVTLGGRFPPALHMPWLLADPVQAFPVQRTTSSSSSFWKITFH